jgi:membrane protease YdiL (CAAX protease family)
MKNSAEISCDHESVNIISAVKINLYLKVILVVFFLVMILFFSFIFFPMKGGELGGILLPMVVLAAIILFIGRYVAWNLFGKEQITITTKSIRYIRDYGLLRTNPKVIIFDYLSTNVEIIKSAKEGTFGIINFYDRVPSTKQLKQIYATGVLLPLAQIKEIEEKIVALFLNEESSPDSWLSYSLN